MREVFIASVARTPMGGLGGSLSSLSAPELGAIAIKAALERAGVAPEQVDELIFGNVLSANVGQAPARQAATLAGLPEKTVTSSVNKVCASGTKALIFGAQAIMLGTADVVVVGGMESMSNAPYYLPKARSGMRYGNGEIVDGIVRDGLTDVQGQCAMGVCAEQLAAEMGFSREDQDTYGIESYRRAKKAHEAGHFNFEMVPVTVPGPRGKPPVIVTVDEEAAKPLDEAKFRSVPPVFQRDNGTVTAPNASPISDGAAALVLISGDKARALGIPVLAAIRGWGDAEQDAMHFTTAPSLAIPKALKHAGISADQVDYVELNEAFSVVALANMRILNLDPQKVNVHGGAVALGHPLGCSGARIVVTLTSILRQYGGKYGVAAVCNGGGGASAVVIERVDSA